MPYRRQVVDPPMAVQVMDLAAASAAGPVVVTALEISAAEYWTAHWIPAGCTRPLLSVRSRITLLPGAPAPEPRLKVAVWAAVNGVNASMLRITARMFDFWKENGGLMAQLQSRRA